MIRGGDTPKQETLWAIEFETGKFAFGHANEDEIFVATSGIGRQIWYADGDGVIAGSTESVDEVTDTIISIYNENFGTNISHLTPDTKLFEVGDTVPNWDAYEKISTLVYIKIQGPGTAGYIINETGFIYTKNNNCYVFDLGNGEVENDNGIRLSDTFKNSIIGRAVEAGLNITQVESKEENFEIGQVMQNWDEYVSI